MIQCHVTKISNVPVPFKMSCSFTFSRVSSVQKINFLNENWFHTHRAGDMFSDSHWHPKSLCCSAPVCVLWLCDCQWLLLPRWTILFWFIPWDSFHEIVILMSQLRMNVLYNFILHGQPFASFLFKHCWWIFNSSFFYKYFILYFDLSLSFFSTSYLLLLFRLSVKMHFPISINIILQSLWLMYIFVCYTLLNYSRPIDAVQAFLFSRPTQNPPFTDKLKPFCTILRGTGVFGTTLMLKWDSRCANSDFTSMSANRLPRMKNLYVRYCSYVVSC